MYAYIYHYLPVLTETVEPPTPSSGGTPIGLTLVFTAPESDVGGSPIGLTLIFTSP